MASASQISIGQRYREVQQRYFGHAGLEWIVRDLLTLTDGVSYARLTCVSDPSKRKTLAFSVLGERHRYQLVDG